MFTNMILFSSKDTNYWFNNCLMASPDRVSVL